LALKRRLIRLIAGITTLTNTQRLVDQRTNELVGEGRDSEIAVWVPRYSAPEPAVSEFHRWTRGCLGVEKFNGEIAKLERTAETAAIASGSLGRFRRDAVNHIPSY